MTKFVVGYEDDICAITDTFSDAIELLFSMVEEDAYISFLYEINKYGTSIEEIKEFYQYPTKDFQTICGFMLSYHDTSCWIEECTYFN